MYEMRAQYPELFLEEDDEQYDPPETHWRIIATSLKVDSPNLDHQIARGNYRTSGLALKEGSTTHSLHKLTAESIGFELPVTEWNVYTVFVLEYEFRGEYTGFKQLVPILREATSEELLEEASDAALEAADLHEAAVKAAEDEMDALEEQYDPTARSGNRRF